jgi:hypothetical protein
MVTLLASWLVMNRSVSSSGEAEGPGRLMGNTLVLCLCQADCC